MPGVEMARHAYPRDIVSLSHFIIMATLDNHYTYVNLPLSG